MAPVRRLAAHYVLTPDGLMRDMVVTVDGTGTILGLSRCERPDSRHGVEFHSGILMPGMVNAHCHLELSHMLGLIPQGCGFAGFGQAMSASREAVPPDRQAAAASYRDARMWSDGVSAVGDISNGGTTAEVKAASKINYHTFVEIFGLGLTSTQRFASAMRLFSERGARVSLTPHSMYSLNEAMLVEAVGAGGLLSVHFMESRQEAELFEGRGEMRKWYDGRGFREDFTAKYSSPAERLVRTIPAERDILLVHNTFVTQEQVEMINGHFGSRVTWVLCPRSNRYISGELPPVDMFRRKGCRIAVGTDSLASNTGLTLVGELETLGGGMEESLRWATSAGAAALGMDDRLGSFEVGKKPGVVLLEKADLANLALTPESVTRRLV
ncbi:MAG: amidohydrolase family protein [Alistipes sp.]|nr:amidohydrolase family protein [Alistipes sp.]